jgi:hypothetical protein
MKKISKFSFLLLSVATYFLVVTQPVFASSRAIRILVNNPHLIPEFFVNVVLPFIFFFIVSLVVNQNQDNDLDSKIQESASLGVVLTIAYLIVRGCMGF